MLPTKPTLYHSRSPLVNQVIAAMIRNRPFDAATTTVSTTVWTTETVSDVLRSIPTFFFTPPRSIGRQLNLTRHRSPLKQRNLRYEYENIHKGSTILGPAAHRDPDCIGVGVAKSIEFFKWVETQFGFAHDETTVKEMALVYARANHLTALWNFLKEVKNKNELKSVITTTTITCLIKCLSEDGLVNEAVHAFYRMKQFHCKPDIVAYNAVILGLCKVGFFKKAKELLQKMELPGFRCPPDTYTYTILISSYCKYGMQTGCRKAVRRRIWEANHLFRLMLFKGVEPDIVTYNSLIDGCCKTNRIGRALELFEDMKKRGCAPSRVTYDSFIRYFSVVNEVDKAIEMLRMMEELKHGIPSTSSFTPIIHSLCLVGRCAEASDFLVELVDRGSIPREYTYKLVCDTLHSQGKDHLLDQRIRRVIDDGIVGRYRQRLKVRPVRSNPSPLVLGSVVGS